MTLFEGILDNVPDWLTRAQASCKENELPDAFKTAQQARDTCRSQGNKRGEAVALLMMAKVAVQNPQGSLFEAGARSASEALHIFQASYHKQDSIGEAAALILTSTATMLCGNFQEAEDVAVFAAAVAKKVGATVQEAFANQAALEAVMLRLEHVGPDETATARALEAAQDASTYFQELGAKEERLKVVAAMANLYLLLDRGNMAIAKGKESQRLCQAMSDVVGEARALMVVAKAFMREKNTDSAIDSAERAAQLFASVGDVYGHAEATTLMESANNSITQERRDMTKRVLNKLAERRGEDPEKVSQHYFVVPKDPVTMGMDVVQFYGFMGRAATVVAPKGSSADKIPNRMLLYKVSWN